MARFEERDGLKYIMEQRWCEGCKDEFPSDLKNYIETFKEIESKLNSDYHPLVNLGAAVNDSGLLTDHGPDHVQMVMKRALQIIGEKRIKILTGYEIFILLLAIHFHDLGNIYGREEHEQKISDVMEKMGEALPLNSIDSEFVRDIAMAHGGYADALKTDKDTIHIIKPIEYRDEVLIRPSALAAILRFADELSEDFSRADKVSKIEIPKENEIYHAYSRALDVNILGNVVTFRYRIPYEYTQKKMFKGKNEKYLYDEIKERIEKCLHELEYCRKYSDGFIEISILKVNIYLLEEPKRLLDGFELRLHGYPDKIKLDSIIERRDQDGNKLPGQQLKYASGEELMNAIRKVT